MHESKLHMSIRQHLFGWLLVLSQDSMIHADIRVSTGQSAENSGFAFRDVSTPSNNDAATNATFEIVSGELDSSGGDLAILHDGRVAASDDQPARNCFFRAGTDGGLIRIDLGSVITVKEVSSYSWHSSSRAAQVYKMYAATGMSSDFNPEPKTGVDPAQNGWTLVANVDTRPTENKIEGGQHAVTISDTARAIGQFRYLLFDIEKTQDRDPFGNTFYSEIDVVDANGPVPTSIVEKPILTSFETDDGKYHFTVDSTEAPDLVDWSEKELKSVVVEWYPRIVALLASEGYVAPGKVSFRFRHDMRGTPASAAGTGVNLNAPWFRTQLQSEARGAVVHELVHVVQNYWSRRGNANAAKTPGWVVEGIADYVRWFLYEPQSHGAEITKENFAKANYDSSYRVTGNFLYWLTQTYDEDLVQELNTAAREGRYAESIWKDLTGKTMQELGDEWKKFQERRLNADQ